MCISHLLGAGFSLSLKNFAACLGDYFSIIKNMQSLEILLTNLIDYAGLFPPAALSLPEAVNNFVAYQRSEKAWLLSRFVIPAKQLSKFAEVALQHFETESTPLWQVSALCSNLDSDLEKVASFNDRYSQQIIVNSIEIKAPDAAFIEQAQLISGFLTTFFEVQIDDALIDLLQAISSIEAFAKVRTGGITADVFPSSAQLARFIKACSDEDIAFKATAGLHHALRGEYPLTYASGSAVTTMHGFLNVFLAATFAQNGCDEEDLRAILEERSSDAFLFENGSITWRDKMVVRGHLRNARNLFALSFGSCSFLEPIEEIQKIVA